MEGYVLVDNGRLTEKEARLNMEQCADFLARMIQKYGPEILADIYIIVRIYGKMFILLVHR